MELIRLAVMLALVACSSRGKGKAVEDAGRTPGKPTDASAPSPSVAVVRDYRVDADAKTGDVKITIEWKDTPKAVRAPGPATKCGTPRTPAVAPTTLWGVPDVLVLVDVDHGKAFDPPPVRIALEECSFSPRAVVAGSALALVSAMPEPTTISLQELARPLGGEPLATKPRTIQLPIAGHEAVAALAPNTVYAVAFGTDDIAAVISATHPYVGVTESSGATLLRGVPIGTHPVRAYLPARNGADARSIASTVTVTEGALAEVTLDLGQP